MSFPPFPGSNVNALIFRHGESIRKKFEQDEPGWVPLAAALAQILRLQSKDKALN
jgi:hypothetical protein